ncbi:2Fe-2S iron-sulfur cluster-binding protein [Sporichthya polymorpha]|uniref:2Fe-2S iron-sulfur cluster-binding protein n=1 Tax=Sporichthya polymorpha TaxID=35751 RepID=UPI00035F8863|nr:2Fe-2S iron-sulfur cluster-binding protein [Sporichthya polymorpha]
MTVRVRPAEVRIDPEPGETVFAAAVRLGYRWPTICGGNGTCRTCVMTVESGRENCGPIGDLEAEGLDALKESKDGGHRLACQTTVTGDVVVTKRGVKRLPTEAAS